MTVYFDDHAEMTEWAEMFLQKLGYTVIEPHPVWVTPGLFAKEMGMKISGMSRLLRRLDCPTVKMELSEKSRIMRFVPTQPLRDFVNQHKRKPTKTRLLSEIVKA